MLISTCCGLCRNCTTPFYSVYLSASSRAPSAARVAPKLLKMVSRNAISRLNKELAAINLDPPPYISVAVDERNIYVWHYLLEGPPDSPYEGGWYHGYLHFPEDYPFSPPEIRMLTPTGRFQTNFPLCLSISSYHPGTVAPITVLLRYL